MSAASPEWFGFYLKPRLTGYRDHCLKLFLTQFCLQTASQKHFSSLLMKLRDNILIDPFSRINYFAKLGSQ